MFVWQGILTRTGTWTKEDAEKKAEFGELKFKGAWIATDMPPCNWRDANVIGPGQDYDHVQHKAELAVSPNTFDMDFTVTTDSTTHDTTTNGSYDGPGRFEISGSAGFALDGLTIEVKDGSYLLETAESDGLEPHSDETHELTFRVVDSGGEAPNNRVLILGGKGRNEFAPFISMGTAEASPEGLVLTLARRYIHEKDLRNGKTNDELLATVRTPEAGLRMIPWKYKAMGSVMQRKPKVWRPPASSVAGAAAGGPEKRQRT